MQQFISEMKSSICFAQGGYALALANLRVTKVKVHSEGVGKVWIKQAHGHQRAKDNEMPIEIKTHGQNGKEISYIIYIQEKQRPGKYQTIMYKFDTLQEIGECQFQVLSPINQFANFNQAQSIQKREEPTPIKKLYQNSPGTTMKKVPQLTVPYYQLIQQRDRHAAEFQKMSTQIQRLSEQNYYLQQELQEKNAQITQIISQIQQCQSEIQKQIRQKQAILDVISGVKLNQSVNIGSTRSSKKSRSPLSRSLSRSLPSAIESQRILASIVQSIQIFNLSMLSKYTHLLQSSQTLTNQLENCKAFYIQSLEEIKTEKQEQQWQMRQMDKKIIQMQAQIQELANENKSKSQQNQKILEEMSKIKDQLNQNNYQFAIKQEQYLKRIYLLENGKQMPSTSSSIEIPILDNKVKSSKNPNKPDIYTLKYHNQNLLQTLRETELELEIQHQQKLNLEQKLQQLMVRIDLIQKRYELEMKFRGQTMLNQSIEVDLDEEERYNNGETAKQQKEMWQSFGCKEGGNI